MNEQSTQQPAPPTIMDRIIEDALDKARRDAVEAVFTRFREDSKINDYVREQVMAYLKSPDGQAKIVALADEAIEKLKQAARRSW